MVERFAYDDDITRSGEHYVFNPYNPLNREITLDDVQSILTKYGVPGEHVRNLYLYRRAFVHQSYCKRPFLEGADRPPVRLVKRPDGCMELHTKSNERLEFLGDAVLELVAKYYLYRRFSKENEGFMTEKKIALVKNDRIGKLALDVGLAPWYVLSKHAEEKKMRGNLKKLGCLFEAFVGAIFLDFNKLDVQDEEGWFRDVFPTGPGFQMAQIFVERVFETHVDWTALINTDDNYKNILQVRIQKEFKVTPEYVELHHSEAGYRMGVFLCLGRPIAKFNVKQHAVPYETFGSFEAIQAHVAAHQHALVQLGIGVHKIKKKSEQLACEDFLKKAPEPRAPDE
jgi:dsRNA-specific ribonuclease